MLTIDHVWYRLSLVGAASSEAGLRLALFPQKSNHPLSQWNLLHAFPYFKAGVFACQYKPDLNLWI